MTQKGMAQVGGLNAAADTARPLPLIRRQLSALLSLKRCGTLQGNDLMLFLLYLVCFSNYLLRSSLGTCAVAMANGFKWDVHAKAALLSAFFWGYFCSNIAGAAAVAKLGGETALSIAAICWSAFFFVVPLAMEGGFLLLWASLLAFGVTESPILAASTVVIASGITPNERGHVIGLRAVSLRVGQGLSSLLTPLLCTSFNWRIVFSLYGCISMISALLWLKFGIVEHMASNNAHDNSHTLPDEDPTLPESKDALGHFIPFNTLKHTGVLTLMFCQCALNSAAYTLMSWGPTYCTDVLDMPLSLVGPALFLPVAAIALGSLAGGRRMDRMLENGSTVLAARRHVLVHGFVVAGVMLAPLGSIRSIPLAGIVICAVCGALGAAATAIMANYVDVAPSQTAKVVGVGNTLATLPGAMGPRIIAAVLVATGSWSFVFGLISAVLLIAAFLFSLFGVAEDVSKKQHS